MARKDSQIAFVNPNSFMGLLASHGKVPGAVSAPLDASVNRRRFRRG